MNSLRLFLLTALLPMAVAGEDTDIWAASDECPQSQALTCYGFDSRYCIAVFFWRGDSTILEGAEPVLDNVLKRERAYRPSRIEVTSHWMDGSELETKKLAKERAKKVVAALTERGVSAKKIKVKPLVQKCVQRDDQVVQRRVEMVFIWEAKKK